MSGRETWGDVRLSSEIELLPTSLETRREREEAGPPAPGSGPGVFVHCSAGKPQLRRLPPRRPGRSCPDTLEGGGEAGGEDVEEAKTDESKAGAARRRRENEKRKDVDSEEGKVKDAGGGGEIHEDETEGTGGGMIESE
ncbi:hypothetical protein TGDOM2_365450 [Toxoplasma gondii GAB2-2007-GAL-DOM2]|uniref:Uncharacterized protein n=4 Tax=Toxoplasma gondii TaxID=5811 RepID=A0A086LCJ4_TOXGO|nr:hypothetical protein TGRH88_080880 [Toxoplasma gondii]KFG43671.1 hypothetical protein TGDOM2_365450 [Toxoplasma gondii GAB2-2007-GAL-DOM2]KFG54362.1 hypothetical protein TGFOU_365450 [Toxoplasma gondii FOU]RQX75285.1 hypothetical protein TGCAST_365450 [Toxoplasma gondii CAST]